MHAICTCWAKVYKLHMRVGVYINMDEFCTKLSVDWYDENQEWVEEWQPHQNTSKAMELVNGLCYIWKRENTYMLATNSTFKLSFNKNCIMKWQTDILKERMRIT